jgi:hypothetical protein
MIIESLVAALTAESSIKALVGTASTRPDSTSGIFPMQAIEQPSMPYLILEQAVGEPTAGETFAGTGPLTTERWTVTAHGTTYIRGKKLAKVVRLFLLSWIGNQTPGKAWIESVAVILEADESEPLGKGTLFSTRLTFEFVYADLDT